MKLRGQDSAYQRIWATVDSIPRGRVATYGQIAREAGLPGRARQVGYALRNLPDGSEIPWHRVLNAAGEVAPRGRPEDEELQRGLLRAEGVRFTERGRVPLAEFRWGGQD